MTTRSGPIGRGQESFLGSGEFDSANLADDSYIYALVILFASPRCVSDADFPIWIVTPSALALPSDVALPTGIEVLALEGLAARLAGE